LDPLPEKLPVLPLGHDGWAPWVAPLELELSEVVEELLELSDDDWDWLDDWVLEELVEDDWLLEDWLLDWLVDDL
jgi:hypothetical protein